MTDKNKYEFTEYYNLTGASFDACMALSAARDDAKKSWFECIEKYGAKSASHNRDGSLRSILVDGDTPNGWRSIGKRDGLNDCVPHKGRKLGKQAIAEINGLPRVEEYTTALPKHIAGIVLFKPAGIVFPTCCRIGLPQTRFVASIPRNIHDGLSVPSDWELITEREFTAYFHEHNHIAAQNRLKESA